MEPAGEAAASRGSSVCTPRSAPDAGSVVGPRFRGSGLASVSVDEVSAEEASSFPSPMGTALPRLLGATTLSVKRLDWNSLPLEEGTSTASAKALSPQPQVASLGEAAAEAASRPRPSSNAPPASSSQHKASASNYRSLKCKKTSQPDGGSLQERSLSQHSRAGTKPRPAGATESAGEKVSRQKKGEGAESASLSPEEGGALSADELENLHALQRQLLSLEYFDPLEPGSAKLVGRLLNDLVKAVANFRALLAKFKTLQQRAAEAEAVVEATASAQTSLEEETRRLQGEVAAAQVSHSHQKTALAQAAQQLAEYKKLFYQERLRAKALTEEVQALHLA